MREGIGNLGSNCFVKIHPHTNMHTAIPSLGNKLPRYRSHQDGPKLAPATSAGAKNG